MEFFFFDNINIIIEISVTHSLLLFLNKLLVTYNLMIVVFLV